MIKLKTILVPSDFSECSDAALRYGLELARRFDARLHLLHVVQDPLTQPWAAEGFSAPLFEVDRRVAARTPRRACAAAVPAGRRRSGDRRGDRGVAVSPRSCATRPTTTSI